MYSALPNEGLKKDKSVLTLLLESEYQTVPIFILIYMTWVFSWGEKFCPGSGSIRLNLLVGTYGGVFRFIGR